MDGLSQIVDRTEAERLATGFVFTEGPLWHPDGFYYFVDVRASKFYRIKPGGPAELLRENTGEGNGTTFDPQGRLVICEGGNRRLTRWPADGQFASSEDMSAKMRRRTMLPALSSSIAWMYMAWRVLATYSTRSSGEKASPFGYSKSATWLTEPSGLTR